jgi:hypothetical protein
MHAYPDEGIKELRHKAHRGITCNLEEPQTPLNGIRNVNDISSEENRYM